MKKVYIVMMRILVLIATVIAGLQGTAIVHADAKPVEVAVTNFKIQYLSQKDADRIYFTDSFQIAFDWDASQNGTDIHAGDYFDVTLPEKMKFDADTTARDFDLLNPKGVIVAKGHVDPGADNHGGNVRVTFTDQVENKYEVKGTLYLGARFVREQITKDEKNKFSIIVNGKVEAETDIHIVGPTKPNNEYLHKWSPRVKDNPNQAGWNVRINHVKATLHNVEITDTLGDSGETYIEDSFKLDEVILDEYANQTGTVRENIDLTDKLTISADKKSFVLKLGDINGEQYRLVYKTTYTPGTQLNNYLKLSANEITKEYRAYHKDAETKGTADGKLASKIKIIKVDVEDQAIVLADAVFEVMKPDGTKFELTTGADGTVTSGVLEQGTYKVREKVAPKGYELNTEEFTLTVSPDGGAIQTVTDKKIKTEISVMKTWVGPKGSSVTVHLYADGADTGKSEVLNDANQWKHTFTDLAKYKTDGTEIQYTVKEDLLPDYTAEISGDAAGGFVITNTNREKVEVPVKKTWIGKEAGAITVHLYADQHDTGKTLTLSAANQWTDKFVDLPKYDVSGKEIAYTVKEDSVNGYTTTIEGDAKTGFTITNREIEKPKTPKTGDSSNHALFSGMFFVSFIAMVFASLIRKQYN